VHKKIQAVQQFLYLKKITPSKNEAVAVLVKVVSGIQKLFFKV